MKYNEKLIIWQDMIDFYMDDNDLIPIFNFSLYCINDNCKYLCGKGFK